MFYAIHTLFLKSVSGPSSVCYKTTLITGSVGGAEVDPPGDVFQNSLGTNYADEQQFPIK